jgi:hypothetical protein
VGWHKLALNLNGGAVQFILDGSVIFTKTGETPRVGMVSVGYRETSAATVGQVRNNFDAVKITAAQAISAVDNWDIY